MRNPPREYARCLKRRHEHPRSSAPVQRRLDQQRRADPCAVISTASEEISGRRPLRRRRPQSIERTGRDGNPAGVESAGRLQTALKLAQYTFPIGAKPGCKHRPCIISERRYDSRLEPDPFALPCDPSLLARRPRREPGVFKCCEPLVRHEQHLVAEIDAGVVPEHAEMRGRRQRRTRRIDRLCRRGTRSQRDRTGCQKLTSIQSAAHRRYSFTLEVAGCREFLITSTS